MSVLRIFLVLLALGAASPAWAQMSFGDRLSTAAKERTKHQVVYDSAYVRIDYPMGDVAPDRGVCADVVIRSLRALGIDLQEEVHRDMTQNFSAYPQHWGLSTPDRNIDHRRVPNLETYFTRQGARLARSDDPASFQPGDIVAWNLRGGYGWLPHIGIVTDQISATGRPMVVHNIGAGPKLEDVLFDWPITGHYRLEVQ
ncbi:DUF1287 domain-containing protein [Hyphococcus sp. DH-69]|uniref:DUF1287 domain-containing protein n=1 Tax=Hyphococcus formosus TaxID=3143534 RepID=UPI00398A77A9